MKIIYYVIWIFLFDGMQQSHYIYYRDFPTFAKAALHVKTLERNFGANLGVEAYPSAVKNMEPFAYSQIRTFIDSCVVQKDYKCMASKTSMFRKYPMNIKPKVQK